MKYYSETSDWTIETDKLEGLDVWQVKDTENMTTLVTYGLVSDMEKAGLMEGKRLDDEWRKLWCTAWKGEPNMYFYFKTRDDALTNVLFYFLGNNWQGEAIGNE